MLRQEGGDEALCQHISHLFTRDPLAPQRVLDTGAVTGNGRDAPSEVAFEGMIEADETSTDHFESVQFLGSWSFGPPESVKNGKNRYK